jgi:hypothetical protein
MEKSSQLAWKIVPLRHFFPLKVVPLIEVLLYWLFEYVVKLGVLSQAKGFEVLLQACLHVRCQGLSLLGFTLNPCYQTQRSPFTSTNQKPSGLGASLVNRNFPMAC